MPSAKPFTEPDLAALRAVVERAQHPRQRRIAVETLALVYLMRDADLGTAGVLAVCWDNLDIDRRPHDYTITGTYERGASEHHLTPDAVIALRQHHAIQRPASGRTRLFPFASRRTVLRRIQALVTAAGLTGYYSTASPRFGRPYRARAVETRAGRVVGRWWSDDPA